MVDEWKGLSFDKMPQIRNIGAKLVDSNQSSNVDIVINNFFPAKKLKDIDMIAATSDSNGEMKNGNDILDGKQPEYISSKADKNKISIELQNMNKPGDKVADGETSLQQLQKEGNSGEGQMTLYTPG